MAKTDWCEFLRFWKISISLQPLEVLSRGLLHFDPRSPLCCKTCSFRQLDLSWIQRAVHTKTPWNWTFLMGWVHEVRIVSSHSYMLRVSAYDEYIDGTTCKCRDECVQLIVYMLRCLENWYIIRELKAWNATFRGCWLIIKSLLTGNFTSWSICLLIC